MHTIKKVVNATELYIKKWLKWSAFILCAFTTVREKKVIETLEEILLKQVESFIIY